MVINKNKAIHVILLVCIAIILMGCNKISSNKEVSNANTNTVKSNESAITPSKEEIIKQIDLGISITEESIEYFIKENPDKKPEEKLNNYGQSSLKQVELLKQLKNDLENNRISNEEAWNKVLEIRDGNIPS